MEIAQSKEIVRDSGRFGEKARRLAELSLQGFPVPPFVAVGKDVLEPLMSSVESAPDLLRHIAEGSQTVLGCARYAVRSSAFSEDTSQHARAGEFMTVLDVNGSGIEGALKSVLQDAREKGEHEFSLIIEEYIAAEHAGVAFTRDPSPGREMVVEWRGTSGEVVGGAAPERTRHVHGTVIRKEPFKGYRELCSLCQRVERHFDEPQDIEWVVSGDRVFIVQSRPITTIRSEQYQAYRRIEEELSGTTDYYFDSGPVAETFSRPMPLSLEVLKYLYAPGMSVSRCYTRCGISFEPVDTFRQFDHYLYIDREKELSQFYPSFSYFGGETLTPHIVRVRGLIRTFGAMRRFAMLTLPEESIAYAEMSDEFARVKRSFDDEMDIEKCLESFDRAYERSFMTNLWAQKALKDLEAASKTVGHSVSELLSLPLAKSEVPDLLKYLTEASNPVVGNSIDIADESPFRAREFKREGDVPSWWHALSAPKRDTLESLITTAQRFESLREVGRWLSVFALSRVRDRLYKDLEPYGMSDRRLAYCATLEEVQASTFDEEILRKRAAEYDSNVVENMPPVIASVAQERDTEQYGVSVGVATGIVRTVSETIQKGDILLVKRLSPELSRYIDTIGGIIASEGGILSHMAIVAREYHIPVVINPKIALSLASGTQVTINGGSGEVK